MAKARQPSAPAPLTRDEDELQLPNLYDVRIPLHDRPLTTLRSGEWVLSQMYGPSVGMLRDQRGRLIAPKVVVKREKRYWPNGVSYMDTTTHVTFPRAISLPALAASGPQYTCI